MPFTLKRLMHYQAAKKALERLHINYLLKHFNLILGNRSKGWDFFSDKHCFEFKSRLYYLDSNFGNTWFGLPEKQCAKYKSENGKEMYWLFMASMPAKPLSDVKKLTEAYITHRDIFFTPWYVYKKYPLGTAKKNNKLGPERHISVKHLKELDFCEVDGLPKAKVYLYEGAGLEYLLKTN